MFSIKSFYNFIYSVLDERFTAQEEHIEPNEYITLEDCLDLYKEGRVLVIENGTITTIK